MTIVTPVLHEVVQSAVNMMEQFRSLLAVVAYCSALPAPSADEACDPARVSMTGMRATSFL